MLQPFRQEEPLDRPSRISRAQVDVNNDGTVDWEELSSFMIEMGMKGWANSGVRTQNYAYAGPIDSARPTHAADQVRLSHGQHRTSFSAVTLVYYIYLLPLIRNIANGRLNIQKSWESLTCLPGKKSNFIMLGQERLD